MKASENEWLIVRFGVILTPSTEPVIADLEEWYRQYNCKSYVTSGLRTPQSQFQIIKQAAIARGLSGEYPKIMSADINTVMVDGSKTIPVWQTVWSRLLVKGFLVNPPVAAYCLYDYVHPKKGKIPAGTLIKSSPHFKGTAFDIGGNGESEDKTINDELGILEQAFNSGSIPNLLSYTVERENNALHCDCKRIV